MDGFYRDVIDSMPSLIGNNFKTFYEQNVTSLCNFIYTTLIDYPQMAGLLRRVIAKYINEEIRKQFGYSRCVHDRDIIILYYLDNESWNFDTECAGWHPIKIKGKWIQMPIYVNPIINSVILMRLKLACHISGLVQICSLHDLCIYKVPHRVMRCTCFADFVMMKCSCVASECICKTHRFVFKCVLDKICSDKEIKLDIDNLDVVCYFKDKCTTIDGKLHIDLEGKIDKSSITGSITSSSS
jgi:hypothetical protein